MSISVPGWTRQRMLLAGLLWDRDALPDAARLKLPRAMRAIPVLLFAVFPLVLVLVDEVGSLASGDLGLDFRHAFWPAGRAVLEGHTPYPPVDARILAHGDAFVYPPFVAILMAPLALIPASVATGLAVATTVCALAGALWVLDVRDWRCYGAAAASPAVLGCVQTAALSGLLALAIALAWRHRTRGRFSLALVALMIAAKLFLWPLLIWVAVIRGARSAITTGCVALALIVSPWALGFPGFQQYPHLLTTLTTVEGDKAYTPRALALALGSGARTAELIALLVGACVIGLAARAARRADAELRVLAYSILAALLLSPVVWSHYIVLLLPVAAIASTGMSWAWLAPFAFWLGGGGATVSGSPRIALGLIGILIGTLPAFARRDGHARDHRMPSAVGSRVQVAPHPPPR